MSKRHQTIPQVSKGTKRQRKLSRGILMMLEHAEQQYRTRCQRVYTLADAVDELTSAEVLGPVAQQIMDASVAIDFDDWLEKPFAEITKTDLLGRWARLWMHKEYDRARWVIQVYRCLLRHAKERHPELKLQDPLLTAVFAYGPDREQ